MIRAALFGYGHFGKEIFSLFSEYGITCTHILNRTSSLDDLIPTEIDICIEVALREGIESRVHWAIDHNKPIIIGTTGWNPKTNSILSYAKEKRNASLVWSYNYSLGVWLFRKILQKAVLYTKNFSEYEFGLFEAHHSKKKDSPSGTMLSIQQDIQTVLQNRACFNENRDQNGIHIDVATLRTGSIPGTHSLLIDGLDETIEITHTSRSRKTFARGIFSALDLLIKYPGVWEFSELLEREFTTNS